MATGNRPSITFTSILTVATLCAFAANSILCRLALKTGSIGALEFTSIRLVSGAAVLWLMVVLLRQSGTELAPSLDKSGQVSFEKSYLWPVLALFVYALCFSLAYIDLTASTGALILFASVHLCMIVGAVFRKDTVSPFQWLGGLVALGGLYYLLSPNLSAPSLLGALLMTIAGVSWGVYSLLATNRPDPVVATARSFIFGLPGVAVLIVIIAWKMFWSGHFHANAYGILLAVISGALASGLGYVLWYMTLQRITATEASVTQLAVPAVTALGGVLFLNEVLTARLLVATIIVIGGIAVTIVGRKDSSEINAQG